MSSSGLWHDIKNNPMAMVIAVGLHVVLIVLLSMNLVGSEVHTPKREPQKTVQAVVVDAAQVEKEAAKLKELQQEQQKKLEQEQNRVKQQIAAEKKRLEEIRKKKAAEERKRKAEQRKQAELKKKREAEKKKKLEAEKNRKAEQARIAEQKRKEEAERKRKEEAEARRKAEEAKRKAEAEAKRKAEAEAKRKAEEEARRKAAEAELQRKLAEEEAAREAARRASELDILRAQYVSMIEQKVGRNWLRPAGVQTTPECRLYVTQSRLGDVIDVKLSDCQGDAVYLRSIERAVRRASPLPSPPDPDVFEKAILFTFRP